MTQSRLLSAAGLGLAALLTAAAPAMAQQEKQWFVPGQHPGAPAHPAPHPVEHPGPGAGPVPAPEQVQLHLPPAPALPEVPRGSMPPAAVIGVLSVPDVLRQSTAYEAADKILAERRQKLNQDAQKEQLALRALGEQLAVDRAKLTPEQLRSREKALQDRIAASRRKFTERNQIIQEQGQFALAQIQRTLQGVVQRVAVSRGMNLVLQSAQVALNTPQFDLTPEVVALLNKALPSVEVPAEGAAPPTERSAAQEAKPDPAHKPAPAHKPVHR